MKKVFKVSLYIRVSTERQANEGDSLEEQEAELKTYCDFRSFNIHKIHIERGKSGGNTNRPEYQKLIADIKAKKINAVVVKKLDRLSRSLLDFETLMRLMNDNDVEFISIKENFDTTTAMGKAMLRVALVFAQLEREQTSERIADVMVHRARQGLFNGGRRVFGYSIIEKERVPYPKEKQIVELVFQKFLETHSTCLVANYLIEQGFKYMDGKKWDMRKVMQVLKQNAYIGEINWSGKTFKGVHQPLISVSTFEKAQEILKTKSFVRNTYTNPILLAKKVYCGICGSPLTPSHTIKPSNKKYFYYRCTGSKQTGSKCISQHFSLIKLENRIIEIMLSLSEEKHFSPIENKLLKRNEEINNRINAEEKAQLHLEINLNQLKAKKDKYLDGLLSNQFIKKERELIQTKFNEIEQEEKQLKTAILKQQLAINQIKEDLINIAEIKKQFITYSANYPFSDSEIHKKHLSKIINEIFCHSNFVEIKFIQISWKEHFDINLKN